MAKILVHRDGQQMGPYEVEDVRQFLYAGTLRDSDLAWQEGMAEWAPLSTVLRTQASPLPGAPQGIAPAAGTIYAYPPAPVSGLAVASLVLGIVSLLGCLFVTAIPGVICGHLANTELRKSQGRVRGDGLALAGLITNYIALLLTALVVAFFAVGLGLPMVMSVLNG